jgi:hypothetical protein
MKKKYLKVLGITAAGIFCSCDKDLVMYGQGDIQISVKKGDEWLHNFPVFAGINKKNPPQIAVWVEDLDGNYITTIYVSHKIATESWMANKGNRRKEALPVWCYARGVEYSDGLFLPTKEEPLVDGISGATPHGNFSVKMHPTTQLNPFVVKIELNHSTDWNENYPKDAQAGDDNYSGGTSGSGQPALVYAATIDLSSERKQYTASIIGHSSPDGTDGEIYPDISMITSALDIVKEITIDIQ